MTADPPRLGQLEQSVMDILWDDSALTVREVIDRLPHDPAYTTIATVLGNLERKKMVVRKRAGRSARYAPKRTREQHAAQMMQHALSTSRDRAASILHFVDAISPGDIEALREHLDRLDGERST